MLPCCPGFKKEVAVLNTICLKRLVLWYLPKKSSVASGLKQHSRYKHFLGFFDFCFFSIFKHVILLYMTDENNRRVNRQGRRLTLENKIY